MDEKLLSKLKKIDHLIVQMIFKNCNNTKERQPSRTQAKILDMLINSNGEISQKEIGERFWHEKNGLLLADNIETLQNENGENENLNLTYAVRDGIISHCGEVDFNSLQPRKEPIDLDTIDKPNQYPPFTWEACIVKIADKIAYLGRDLEDAQRLSILQKEHIDELQHIQSQYFGKTLKSSTNTALIHSFCVEKKNSFYYNCYYTNSN